MPPLTISAVVLRSVNYRDNDRILTLLSPGMGRVEALARGCRRPKSPLMSASEVFCTGEYILFRQGDRNIITSCTLNDSFYPLRLDYGLLSCGVYLMNLCEAAAMPGEECAQVFWLLLKSLNRLAYGTEDRKNLICCFLLHYALILGYKPRLNHCVHCGKKLTQEEPSYFDCDAGGLVCSTCPKTSGSLPISIRQAIWMRNVLNSGPESCPELPNENAPYDILRCYVHTRLEKPIKSEPVFDPPSG